jgi:hypothetical protein
MPFDLGLFVPDPELYMGYSVIVPSGVVPSVDPSKVKSGSILHTKAKLCPSPISNSEEEI